MDLNKTYSNDKVDVLDDEFEQIRVSRTMYISRNGNAGGMHLIKEAVNNGFDEETNPNSPADALEIIFKEFNQEFTISDNGRGIDPDDLVSICTKKHSSTKFNRTKGAWMKDQAGRNGVGMTIIAALTDYYRVRTFNHDSIKGSYTKTIEFFDGVIKEHTKEPLTSNRRGLEVTFIPSAKYLAENAKHITPLSITTDDVNRFLHQLSFIMPKDTKIQYYGYETEKDIKNGKAKAITYTRQGVSENVKYLSNSLIIKPVEVYVETEDFDIELAFSYNPESEEMVYDSYGNYIITTEDGVHVTVTKNALSSFFVEKAKELDPNNKYQVIPDDAKKGLVFAVNLKHVDPVFEGQHKSKVSNSDVAESGVRLIKDALRNYFAKDNAVLLKIINHLRSIAKLRMDVVKVKTANKKEKSFIDDILFAPSLYPLKNRNSKGYKEIAIVEGKSAGGQTDNVRNKLYQAILATGGVVSNIYGMTDKEISEDSFFGLLIEELGCGFGDSFDISKLRYDKIIISTDADADGGFIGSSTLDFFRQKMPGLITNGFVYKAMPPLMLLKDTSVKKYRLDNNLLDGKMDYYKLIFRTAAENFKVAIPVESEEGDGTIVNSLSKKELVRWMIYNIDYHDELQFLIKRTSINSFLLEHICYYYDKCVTDKTFNAELFKSFIETNFNELTYDIENEILYGSLNGSDVRSIVDSTFIKSSKRFRKVQRLNPYIHIYCTNSKEKTDGYDDMTIGSYFEMVYKLIDITIEQRYKGLGEVDAEILFMTTMNPKTRKLLRLTVDNIDSVHETFDMFHSKTKKARQQKRDLIDRTVVRMRDLDN